MSVRERNTSGMHYLVRVRPTLKADTSTVTVGQFRGATSAASLAASYIDEGGSVDVLEVTGRPVWLGRFIRRSGRIVFNDGRASVPEGDPAFEERLTAAHRDAVRPLAGSPA